MHAADMTVEYTRALMAIVSVQASGAGMLQSMLAAAAKAQKKP